MSRPVPARTVFLVRRVLCLYVPLALLGALLYLVSAPLLNGPAIIGAALMLGAAGIALADLEARP